MSRRDPSGPSGPSDHTAVQQARLQGREWARQLLARDDWVLLDTETTGLDGTAEVVELAVLAPSGQLLVDTLLRPAGSIPLAASAIHGLTDATVQDAPTMVECWPHLLPLLSGKRLVAYHVAFDVRVLRQTAGRYGLPFPLHPRTACVMEAYALFCGRRSAASGRPVRQTLAAACAQLGIVETAGGGSFHRAADDCRATLALLQAMAQWRVKGNGGGGSGDDDGHLVIPAAVPPAAPAAARAAHPTPGVLQAAASHPAEHATPSDPELARAQPHWRARQLVRLDQLESARPQERGVVAVAVRGLSRELQQDPPSAVLSTAPLRSPPPRAACPTSDRSDRSDVPSEELLPTIIAAWSQIRGRCKQRSLRVAALLASAHPHAIAAGCPPVLVLQADYPFHYQQLCTAQCRAIVGAALQAVLHQSWQVCVTLAPQSPPEPPPHYNHYAARSTCPWSRFHR